MKQRKQRKRGNGVKQGNGNKDACFTLGGHRSYPLPVVLGQGRTVQTLTPRVCSPTAEVDGPAILAFVREEVLETWPTTHGEVEKLPPLLAATPNSSPLHRRGSHYIPN